LVSNDITFPPINLVQRRLRDTFHNDLGPYKIVGAPTDLASAEALKEISPHQFEWWAVDLVNARPAKDHKKGDNANDCFSRGPIDSLQPEPIDHPRW
jgi:site-specific DNA-methyltransferase (adenine-specific)